MGKQVTAEEWQDSLGQTFRVGDCIAIATVDNKSPNLVYAEVIKINRTNAQGEPYFTFGKGPATAGARYGKGEPTVVVSAKPFASGRNFTRWSDRAVGYTVIGNIIKLSPEQLKGLDQKLIKEGK